MKRDPSEIKSKIIQTLESKGPSLPITLAKAVEMDLIFGSAFLSELLSEKKVFATNLRVGSSPIYYLKGQEEQLEKYSENLKSKEKEAYLLLKEKRFLEESKQEPAIRVALSQIKDFSKRLEKDGKIYWKYYLEPEKNLHEKIKTEKTIEKEKPKKKPEKIEEKSNVEEEKNSKKNEVIKKKTTRKNSKKQDEKFFNKVKKYLDKKEIKISDILGFAKKDLILKIEKEGKEFLLVAYNKKRITEIDILNAYKKSQEEEIPFLIFSLGEPAKKTLNIIEASKNLVAIEKIE